MTGYGYQSYAQGLREAMEETQEEVPVGFRDKDIPLIDEEALDKFEYLRGQVRGLTKVILNMKARMK